MARSRSALDTRRKLIRLLRQRLHTRLRWARFQTRLAGRVSSVADQVTPIALGVADRATKAQLDFPRLRKVLADQLCVLYWVKANGTA